MNDEEPAKDSALSDICRLERVLKNGDLAEMVKEISRKTLVEMVATALICMADWHFVLHDEMHRLASRYCWPEHVLSGLGCKPVKGGQTSNYYEVYGKQCVVFASKQKHCVVSGCEMRTIVAIFWRHGDLQFSSQEQ